MDKSRKNALEAGKAAAHVALDLLIPPRCVSCGVETARAQGVCQACWSELRFVAEPLCRRCGLGLAAEGADAGGVCGACRASPPRFDRARAVLAYDDASRPLIVGYKRAGRLEATPLFVRWLEVAGREILPEADLIAPVPLHWRRMLWRRFNQAAELARALARYQAGAYAPDLLRRRKPTRSQAGLGPAARRRNVVGAFAVSDRWKARLAGQRVLLVDDVFTTGATAERAAATLVRAGATAVDVLTVARVERPRRI